MQKNHPSILGELNCTLLKDFYSATECNEQLVIEASPSRSLKQLRESQQNVSYLEGPGCFRKEE